MAGDVIGLRIDDADIRRMIRTGDRDVRLGASRVLTRTARAIRIRVAKGTAASLRVPLKIVNRRFYVRASSSRNLVATITAYLRPINPAGAGSVATKGGGGVTFYGQTWPRSFFMQGKGGPIVAERKPESASASGLDARGRPRRGRLPVEAKKVYVREKAEPIGAKVTARLAQEMVTRTLPREILFRLQRAARRY